MYYLKTGSMTSSSILSLSTPASSFLSLSYTSSAYIILINFQQYVKIYEFLSLIREKIAITNLTPFYLTKLLRDMVP